MESAYWINADELPFWQRLNNSAWLTKTELPFLNSWPFMKLVNFKEKHLLFLAEFLHALKAERKLPFKRTSNILIQLISSRQTSSLLTLLLPHPPMKSEFPFNRISALFYTVFSHCSKIDIGYEPYKYWNSPRTSTKKMNLSYYRVLVILLQKRNLTS